MNASACALHALRREATGLLRRAGSGLRRLVSALTRRLLLRRGLVFRRRVTARSLRLLWRLGVGVRLGVRVRLGLLRLRLPRRRVGVRWLGVLLRVRQGVLLTVGPRARGRRLLAALLRVTAVGDLAEADVRGLAYGRVVDLEVGRLLELEDVGDQVGRHRLDLGVVDPHVGVVVATAVGDAVLGLGQLPLQLQEVGVALQARVRLDADDQVADGAGQLLFHLGPLRAGQ